MQVANSIEIFIIYSNRCTKYIIFKKHTWIKYFIGFLYFGLKHLAKNSYMKENKYKPIRMYDKYMWMWKVFPETNRCIFKVPLYMVFIISMAHHVFCKSLKQIKTLLWNLRVSRVYWKLNWHLCERPWITIQKNYYRWRYTSNNIKYIKKI